MLANVFKTFFYSTVFSTLLLVDYTLGNGLIDLLQRAFCRMICFIRKSLKAEAKSLLPTDPENPVSVPVLILEILVLSLTLAFLYKFKSLRTKDHLDKLLQESKDTLRQTNDFLEKWRLRRVPTDHSYLDEEPQKIPPFKLEVPILHMAIVDTRATSRSQPERGDAGDTINITDSTLLSVTSLVSEDMDPIDSMIEEKLTEVTKHLIPNDRFLWDVVEEDNEKEISD